jgi:hypothetical protein
MQAQSFALSHGQTTYANSQLAEKIITAKGKEDKSVKVICSKDFLIDPTTQLINEMIKRNVGLARDDDSARAFVIGQIPGFIEKASSPDYLRSFAVSYFKNDPNRLEIIQIFEKSLLNEAFQSTLKSAIESFKGAKDSFYLFYQAENSLRSALTIFGQAAQLKEYTFPIQAGFE